MKLTEVPFNQIKIGDSCISAIGNKGKKRSEEYKIRRKEIDKNRPKVTEETKKKISQSLSGDRNPAFGKESSRKNRTYEEIYGVEKAKEVKKKNSESQKGKLKSEEFKANMSLIKNSRSLKQKAETSKKWKESYTKNKNFKN